MPGRPHHRRRRRTVCAAAAFVIAILGLGTAACTGGDDEPTMAEVLAELEGRDLTPAEVAQREQVAVLLCRLDEPVLRTIWDRLEPRQLEFQDFVFARQCPERNEFYGEATGRFGAG